MLSREVSSSGGSRNSPYPDSSPPDDPSPSSFDSLTITPDESRVLGELRGNYLAIDNARREAVQSDRIINVLNAVRAKRDERTLAPEDVPLILDLEQKLLHIAADPFAPLPMGYATYQGSVNPDQIDKRDDNKEKESEGLVLYERGIRFRSYHELAARLESATQSYPAVAPRLAPIVEAVRARVDQGGPAYLWYTGCTIAGTPLSRAENDSGVKARLIGDLFDLWKITEVLVFKVTLPEIATDIFEYRGQRKLQLLEHSLISVRFPLNLNSAPGGFIHDFRVDLFPPCPWPEFARETPDAAMIDDVANHLTGMQEYYAGRAGAKPMAEGTLSSQIEAAKPRFLLRGRSPIVAVGKDTPREEFLGLHDEIGYRERLAGPGPQATNAALLHQHGIADPPSASTAVRLDVLPPFTDLYPDLWHYWVIGVIFLSRFLYVHHWPAVIWVESAEVGWIFVVNAMSKIELHGNSEDFYQGRAHDPAATISIKEGSIKMNDYVGYAIITELGGGRFAIVLMNYDRGAIKYDPVLAQDRLRLQLAADAAHQRRFGAYLSYVSDNGYPSDLAGIHHMHDLGEAAVPGALRAELEELRQRVQERERVIQSLRKRAAIARGSNIGFTSEGAKEHRRVMYERHEKADGEKQKKGVDDPLRVAQFDGLLTDQRQLDNQRLPHPWHPCRPRSLSLEEWRSWFMKLEKGVEIRNAASVFGKNSRKLADTKAYHDQHFGAWRADNPGTGFCNDLRALDAVNFLACCDTFTPFELIFAECEGCGRSAIGLSGILHFCPEDEEAAEKAEDRDLRFIGSVRGLNRWRLLWAGGALELEYLVKQIDLSSLLRLDTGDCLRRASADLSGIGWAAVVPPEWRSFPIPDVLVDKGASEQWILANAIGLALSCCPGHPALELHAHLLSGTDELRKYIQRLDLENEIWTVYGCAKDDCSYVRPYRTTNHDCIREDGSTIPNKKGARPRSSTKLQALGRVTWFHDLPARVKSMAWASFVTKQNTLNVSWALFKWPASSIRPPPPGSKGAWGIPVSRIDSPDYGANAQLVTAKQQPSAVRSRREARLKEIEAQSSAAGPSTPAPDPSSGTSASARGATSGG